MRIRRRAFLAGAAALPLAGRLRASEMPELRASVARVQLAPEGLPKTEAWVYDGRIPGPEIRVAQGARLRRRLVNDLPQGTTIHWHGIRIENAMDGVPGLTQELVAPGESFDYDFALPDAGTYWYHTHNRTWEQMARGLSGPLIVEEPEAPDIDRELVLQLADWRMQEPADFTDDFGSPMDRSHAGRIGNYVTVNGTPEPRHPVARHQRLRLRLINAAPARVFELALQGLEGWVVALDGMPLETPQPAGELVLAPAQRADLLLDVTAQPGEDAFLIEMVRGQGYALALFPVSAGARARREPPAALPPNPGQAAVIDLAQAQVAPMEMEGGAMRGIRQAWYNGELLDGRALAQQGQFWALNGVADMPESPLALLSRGETLRIPMINDTAFPHAMHLHGHHFREVMADGTLGPSRDTLLVQPTERREIAFVADNPGDWLFHCHMLSHRASGMVSWLRVA